jgi:hypothetical protein
MQTTAYGSIAASIPILDVHTHFVGRAETWNDREVVKTALELMDGHAIQKSIVMPPPQIDARVVHDHTEIARTIRDHPKRFAFVGGGARLNSIVHRHLNWSTVNDDVRRMFAAEANGILAAGAAGFGEMAALHISARRGHPYEFVPADHPLLKLLADIAAERDVPIELHMDAVSSGMAPPARFAEGENPPLLPETLSAFERLLAHNTRAKIIWAHGGSDPVGAMTPATIGRLMQAHANLFVSLRVMGADAPMHNKLLTPDGLDAKWHDLLVRRSDRFMIGTDTFFVAAGREGSGPGSFFAQRNVPKLRATRHFLALLPRDIAAKIANGNASRVYG